MTGFPGPGQEPYGDMVKQYIDTGDSLNTVALASKADLVSGTVPDAQIPSAITRDSEMATALAGKADLVSGTVPDAQIPAAITRDSELTTAINGLLATYARLSGVQATATASGALVAGKHNPVDATSGNLTMALADATDAGQMVVVSKKDATANTVTLSAAHLRDGGAGSIVLVGQYEAITLTSKADGSWWPIGDHKTKAYFDTTYVGALGKSITTALAPQPWVNAKNFGAKFDGATDDTAAIQAAIDFMAALGGGAVECPVGTAIVNGGLTFPVNKIIRLRGQGVSASGNISVTQLSRTSGTTPIINAAGTGQATNQRVLLELHDMSFSGGDRAASVVSIKRASQCYLNNIRIAGNNGGSGLECREVWDSRLHNVYVQTCGGSGTIPAVYFGAMNTGVVDVCDGVHILGLSIHSSFGIDLQIDGNASQNAPSSNFQVVNLNIEGTGSGTSGSPDTYNNIDLVNLQGSSFTNTRISLPTGRASAVVIRQGSTNAGDKAVMFTNTVLDSPGSSHPAVWVQQSAGSLVLNGINIIGQPTNVVFSVTSSVAAGRFQYRGLVLNGFSNLDSGFIGDGRTVNERLNRSIVPVQPVTSTNAITLVGSSLPGWPLNDSATDSVTALIPIPPDANPTGHCTIRIHWVASATGNALFRWIGKVVNAGDDPAAAATNRDLTAAAAGTAGRVAVAEWNASSQGFTPTPGGRLLVQIARMGSDALDTVTGTIYIVGIEMIYHRWT